MLPLFYKYKRYKFFSSEFYFVYLFSDKTFDEEKEAFCQLERMGVSAGSTKAGATPFNTTTPSITALSIKK
jgi:hypothetical protein